MVDIKFVWEERKALSNLKKHKISFEEAQTVFHDVNAFEYWDEEHSELEEDRFLLLGYSFKARMLLVCYCERGKNMIRIISARKATKSEQKDYYR